MFTRTMIQLFNKIFKRKDPMDFLVDYVNDNLETIYNNLSVLDKDKEIKTYCIEKLAMKKYEKEMNMFLFQCKLILEKN